MLSKRFKAMFRVLVGLLMLFTGIIIALLTIGNSSQTGVLGQGMGFAFIVTGCISVFQETVLLPLRKKENEV